MPADRTTAILSDTQSYYQQQSVVDQKQVPGTCTTTRYSSVRRANIFNVVEESSRKRAIFYNIQTHSLDSTPSTNHYSQPRHEPKSNMHATRSSHCFGVFFIFLAALLLIVATLTAPVVDDLSLFNLIQHRGQEDEEVTVVGFGTFGFCTFSEEGNTCQPVSIGCDVFAAVDFLIDGPFDGEKCGTAESLTHAMVMHPIASAVAFIAAFMSMAAGFAGSLIGGITAVLAWVFVMVAMAIDFTVRGIVKKRLDDHGQNSDMEGQSGPVMWCVVAAFVFLTVCIPIVLYTYFVVRRAEKRRVAPAHSYGRGSAASATTAEDKDIYRP
ncbi:hypothetical protein M409DRAFT_20564 [Zasmidium cellare ATCC 36951]|uniref:Pali-domain-containing protein n=1 Tax=Zasmidium cellare ATCC 36951 TaxID=1080233 RepID=A0A6A6CQJ6_ZASCE|nr:uncharacterized protein M409DRAFT_20564 [Zasmidium cellare ATCC 36951]KAF2169341.1 hypothetical protein M409DRAFT_20564 [Zasmidium cellare ATCC 36951]